MSDMELLEQVICDIRGRIKRRNYAASWRAANSEHFKAYQKEYGATRKERRAKNAKLRYLKTKSLIAEQSKNRRAANQLKIKAANRRYYQKNKSKILLRNKQYYEANKKRHHQWVLDYYKRNPHVRAATKAKRRMQISATIENSRAIEDFIRIIRRSRRVKCSYCDRWVTGKKAHIDHVIPLSRGGTHTVGNLNPSCGSCNSRKNTKLLSEWDGIKQPTLL